MSRSVFGGPLLVLLSGTLFVACSDSSDPPPPAPHRIDSVAPATGHPNGGEVVTITGSGFTGASTVEFGANAATILSQNGTQLVVSTPAGAAGTVTITVTTGTDTANANYTYAIATGTSVFQFIAGTDKWLLNIDLVPGADANGNAIADLAEALNIANNDSGGTGFPNFEGAATDLFSQSSQFYRNNPDGTLAAGGAPVSWRRTQPGVGTSPAPDSVLTPSSVNDYNEMAVRNVGHVAPNEEQTGVVGRALSEVNTNNFIENDSGGTTGGGGADPVLGTFADAIVFFWNSTGMPQAFRTQANIMEEFANVVVHECGHSMGLQHINTTPTAPANTNIMAATASLAHTNIYAFDDPTFTTFLGYMPGPSRLVHPSAWAPRRLLAASDVVLVATPQRVEGGQLVLNVERVLCGSDVSPGSLVVGGLATGAPFDMATGSCLVYLRRGPDGLELAAKEASLMPLTGKDPDEWCALIGDYAALDALEPGSTAWKDAYARRLGRSLASSDDRVRLEALIELAINEELVASLNATELASVSAALTAPDACDAQRSRAVQVLLHRGDASQAPALIAAGLACDSERVLDLIGAALCDLSGRDGGRAAVRAALGAAPDPAVRSRACVLLGRLGDDAVAAEIATDLDGASPSAAWRAADALGRLGDASVLPQLQATALDESRELNLRRRALRAIGRIGTPAAKAWLTEQYEAADLGPWRDALRFARDYPTTWKLH